MTILPQLEQDLYDAAQRQLATHADLASSAHDSQSARQLRWPRLRRRLEATSATLPVILAVLVAVAVAAIALTTFRDHEPTRSPAVSSMAHSSPDQLVQSLAILRTAQTKADLDPRFERLWRFETLGRHAALGYPKLDRGLMRVVKVASWHAAVAFEPVTWQPSPSSPHRSDGLIIAMWIGAAPTIPPSSEVDNGPKPASVATLRSHGLALFSPAASNGTDRGVIVVPDGVAKVTLGAIRLLRRPPGISATVFAHETATSAVHDNLAVLDVACPTVTIRRGLSSLFVAPAVARTTWFDASGNAIKQITTTVDLPVRVRGNGHH